MKVILQIVLVLLSALCAHARTTSPSGSVGGITIPEPVPHPEYYASLSILDSIEVNGEMKASKAVIHFRWDEATYESSYLGNAAASQQLLGLFDSVGRENIQSVDVVAYASPEGVYEHNLKLSRQRARQFSTVFSSIAEGGISFPISVKAGGEAWDLLRERILGDKAISQSARNRIIRLLDDSSVKPDTKKWRLAHGWIGSTPEEGDLYKYLLRSHYRYLRCLEININYKIAAPSTEGPAPLIEMEDDDSPEKEPGVEVEPENLPDPEPKLEYEPETDSAAESELPAESAPAAEKASERRRILGLSTNIPYDITWVPGYGLSSIPSFSLEYYPRSGRYSFGADVEWPMWRHPDEHRYLQINNITLWARRYFQAEENKFSGLYLLGNINAVRYGIGFNADKGWEGEGVGASLGIGYKIYLGRRFYLDAGLAAGLFYSGYDPYVWGNDSTGRYYYDYYGNPDEFTRRNNRLFWAGPTRVYISLGFDIFGKKK